jgi:SAM-dependent methyltransferase
MPVEPGRVHGSARGFDRAADAYEAGRPEYPPEAIGHLAAELGLRPGRTVLDLAAGTGKLTRSLLGTGARVVAVEPSEGMRRVFREAVHSVELLDGTAEAIPLPDGSVDAATVGQAFHWFRAEAALPEIARVLRADGALGLVWNRRDESVAWVGRLGALIRALDRVGSPNARDEAWAQAFGPPGPFGPLERREFRHVQRLAPDGVVQRALSVSFVALAPQAEQRALAVEVRALLDSSPETRGRSIVELPYETVVYLARRRDGPDGAGSPE